MADDKQFVPTGVSGLDHVLMGGYLREGFYLVQGDPGSGKTTLALQFVLGRKQAGERCLYITLTESRRDLNNACRAHGWALDGIEICDLSKSAANLTGEPESSVFHPSETELGETTQAVLAAVENAKPEHVVFDGLSEMRLLAGSPLVYRRQLLALKEFFAERKATVLLLDDRSSAFGNVQPESLVGGNVVMERTLPQYGRARRRLYATKVRGSDFREGYHDYEIVQGGVVVHPRLVAAEHHEQFEQETLPSGVANLDTMLSGGLSAGSTTLLLGPAGVGKSTIAMQFAVTAMKAGKKAAIYVFDEVITTLVDRTEKLCLSQTGGVRDFIRSGLLHAQQVDPAEMSPGAFAYEVRRAVEAGVKVVVIDSLNGYLNAMPEERFLTTHLHELFSYLNQKGVVTIMVVAQHGMIVGSGGGGEVDVSYLADTVLLFRYFETRGEILQALSVFKKRTGPHERTLRQLKISEQGVAVGEPLREFRGVMTGVPQYDGQTEMLPSGGEEMTADDRVLVLMPTAKDGERTRKALAGGGLGCTVCKNLTGLCLEIERGAGVALLTEEAVLGDRERCLQQTLAGQPAWSNLPLVVLAREGSEGVALRQSMNATLVERPVKLRSLLSVLRAALRSRRHQYAIRDHLAERARMEEELRDADRKKDDFIALLAHELRNPLAPIRNGLQVLRLAAGDADAVGQARAMMDRQLSHMVRLIDDLLDVSRISRNKMDLRRERILLTDVVASAVETARPLIEAAGHELIVSLPPRPVFLDADMTRLAQVFSNLLTNSAKYTERGGKIRLAAERRDSELIVVVRDNGIGIPAEALPRIFDMFSQVDRSFERSAGGLGIGLALVRGLVEMHGGTVTADSPGQGLGSTFTVRLPVLEGRSMPQDAGASYNGGHGLGRRVLVVDDNPDSAASMALMLRLLGDEVRTAGDGLAAVEVAEAFLPQVILMDIGMPRLDGLDATRRIRDEPWGKGIAIIAVTGWGQEADRERSRAAGCDGHLVKPVNLPDLEKLLAEKQV